MSVLSGVLLAALVVLGANRLRREWHAAFYAAMLAVIAAFYPLFAISSGASLEAGWESLVASGFVLAGLVSLRTGPWLVVAALSVHGLLDIVHPHLIEHPGVPTWWPVFCLSYDFAAAVFVGARLRWRKRPAAAGRLRAPSAPAGR